MSLRFGRSFFGLFSLGILLTICAAIWHYSSARSQIKARVNDQVISISDVQKRAQVVLIYFKVEQKQAEKVAFSQLFNAAVSVEILKNNGWLLADSNLELARPEVEQDPLIQGKLSEIQSLFMVHSEYLKYFILPSYVQKAIPQLYRQKMGSLPQSELDPNYTSWLLQENSKVKFKLF